MRCICSIGAALWLASMPAGVQSETLGSEAYAKAFEDWRVVCTKQETSVTCQMLQSVAPEEGQTDVLLVSLYQSPEAQSDIVVITVPVGVYLAPGIELSVDGGRAFRVLYETCDTAGCYAGFKLSEPILRAFKKSRQAATRVWLGKTSALDFPVDLNGFTAAYKYYLSEMSSQ